MMLSLHAPFDPLGLRGLDLVLRGTPHKYAYFSSARDDARYRYALGRNWSYWLSSPPPLLVACMLNPSTASEMVDDPTVRRLISFAKREGAGGLVVVNCFAFRATDPKMLREAPNPVGPLNGEVLRAVLGRSSSTPIAAWGRPPVAALRKPMAIARSMRERWQSFGLTDDGYPRHPLYLRNDAPLMLFDTSALAPFGDLAHGARGLSE